jgi:hypothetical protein
LAKDIEKKAKRYAEWTTEQENKFASARTSPYMFQWDPNIY